jgi:hypothetical protein
MVGDVLEELIASIFNVKLYVTVSYKPSFK